MKAEMSRDGKMIVVTIPMVVKKRGGRKLIIAPEGMDAAPPRDETLAKLVAKAHKWLKLLESGQYRSIKALAENEQIDDSYMAKVLRLTLLAPDIVTAIIDGRQPDHLTWEALRKPFPMLWREQRAKWGIPEPG
ncbi:MAG: hypothetical protein HQL85_15730 [Magnetococcales bacterium]|nr:hypothetical protein [Magnetococcales bacterium]